MRSATVALIALVVLTGCGSGDEDPSPSAGSTPTGVSTPPGVPTARAVYWLGATESLQGPRLYREFVARPAVPDPVRDAVELMLADQPADQDYTSLWADGTTVRGVRTEGTTAVVDLSEQARTNGGGSAFEAATLQQLVHTVTAADPSLTAVQLLIAGEPVETLWGSTDASQPMTRSEAAFTLGPVWLDVPEGGTIDGTFGGTATVFEATVSWQVRRNDTVVDEGFSTATTGAPGRGEWAATTDAAPGEYELWAFESSAKDGSVTWLDTKNVTVTG